MIGYFLAYRRKKVKKKFLGQLMLKERKKEKLTDFRYKWPFLEEKRTGLFESVLHVGGKKKL